GIQTAAESLASIRGRKALVLFTAGFPTAPSASQMAPTRESVFARVGDLEAVEVFGVAHQMLSKTQALLLVYTFRNRLNLVLTCSASLFTREETELFIDLLVKKLMAPQVFPTH
ncbi:MAG: hypothetical protein ACLPVO_11245, partial [Desulfomonilaceae bacterium]